MKFQKKIPKTKSQKTNSSTFADHLSELQNRILIVFLIFVLGSLIGYLIHQDIFNLLIIPLNQPIYYTSPAGGFEFTFQLSLFFGFLLSLPVFVYQTIRFVEPALPQKFPHLLSKILFASNILMLMGISFAYFVSLPAALYFLNTYSTDQIKALISTSEYFSFITRYLMGFGIIFQLPLVLIAVNKVHKIAISSLFSKEKYVVLSAFIFAGILTPTPDIFNQLVMAIPIILLYQISILLVWIMQKKPSTIIDNN
ncbi:MAG: twin-arginine translocase subunit TatC [Pseudomonadales bacterium]|nr:twin-arginine translocase subunit TatC [Pseudomonadales bacterium]